MIQRKQTLFLLELIFLSIALLFIPVAHVITKTTMESVQLMPVHSAEIITTPCHMAAIAINLLILILSVITLFMYKKRELQIKLCYSIAALWVLLAAIITACPLVEKTELIVEVSNNYFSCVIGAFAVIAALLAARFIRKDIELLKSADRIR